MGNNNLILTFIFSFSVFFSFALFFYYAFKPKIATKLNAARIARAAGPTGLKKHKDGLCGRLSGHIFYVMPKLMPFYKHGTGTLIFTLTTSFRMKEYLSLCSERYFGRLSGLKDPVLNDMITGDAFFDRTVKIDGTSYDYIIVAMHPGFRKRILQMIADDGLFFLSFKRNEFELAF